MLKIKNMMLSMIFCFIAVFASAQHLDNYGEVLDTFKGIPAKSNGLDTWSGDGQYQCTEYVKRFYAGFYQYNINFGVQSAYQIFNKAKTHSDFNAYENGSNISPQPGDIICYGGGNYGHVGIIKYVNFGNKKVVIVDQNRTSYPRLVPYDALYNGQYSITNEDLGGSYYVQGWVRLKSNDDGISVGEFQTESYPEITQAFINCYNKLNQYGKKRDIGQPFDNGGGPYVHRLPGNNVWIQDFKRSDGQIRHILYNKITKKAYLMYGGIAEFYFQHKEYGAPFTDPIDDVKYYGGRYGSQGGIKVVQKFQDQSTGKTKRVIAWDNSRGAFRAIAGIFYINDTEFYECSVYEVGVDYWTNVPTDDWLFDAKSDGSAEDYHFEIKNSSGDRVGSRSVYITEGNAQFSGNNYTLYPPQNLHLVSKTMNQIRIAWNKGDNTENVKYNIYCNSSKIKSNYSATDYVHSGLSSNTSYSYYITAVYNGQESNASNTLNVTTNSNQPTQDPELDVSPTTINFGTSQNSKNLQIKNPGQGTLNWNLSESLNWLECSPTSGSLNAGQAVNITLTADRSNLSTGTYSGTISITSNGGNQNVSVSIKKQEENNNPIISLSKNQLDFGAHDTQKSFYIENIGQGILTGTVSDNKDWMSCSRKEFSLNSGEKILIVISANRNKLSVGNYQGNVLISSNVGDKKIKVKIKKEKPKNYPLIDNFSDNFEDANANDWQPTDSQRWSVVRDAGDYAYYLHTPFRDQFSAINYKFKNFDLSLKIKSAENLNQTITATACILFNYQNLRNTYYLKFCQYAPENKLYLIKKGKVTVIATANISTLDDNYYHKARVVKKNGKITVYFDNQQIMSCNDNTFSIGRIAVGSWKSKACFDDVKITSSQGTGIAEDLTSSQTQKFYLKNYPNPFNPETTIEFTLSQTQFVTLNIYNLKGEKVRELINQKLSAGQHACQFDAQNLSSGIYFYILHTPFFCKKGKMLLQK